MKKKKGLIKIRKLFFLLILFVGFQLSAKTIVKSSATFIDSEVLNPELLKVLKPNNKGFNLFSHGRSGELFINGRWLEADGIIKFLKNNSQYLKSKTQILNIYGCEFAKGKKGLEAVSYIESILGIQVNASTNITGKDGDWLLEIGNVKVNMFEDYMYNLQLDHTHYIPPFYSPNYNGTDNSENYVYLSTPSLTDITVTVVDGLGTPYGAGNNGTAGEYVISKGNPYRVAFGALTSGPLLMGTASVGSVLTGKGLVLTSTADFYANQKGGGTQQSYSLTSKGTAGIGRHFKWANSHANGGDPLSSEPSGDYVSIYAVEDATVTISDYADGVTFDGAVDADNIDLNDGSNEGETVITLLAGESIMVRANTSTSAVNRNELIGADISSTGNIVVNAGSNFLSWATKRDFGIDQIVPIELIGTEYVVIAGANAPEERVTVTATQDNTDIFVNGSSTPIATINEGDYYDILGTNFTTEENMYITTNHPVYIYHSLYGATAPNTVGSNFLPPLSCFGAGNVDEISNIFMIGNTTFTGSYMILNTLTGADITINGIMVPDIYESTVTGSTEHITYRIPYTYVNTLAGVNDTYTIESTKSLAVGVFGGNTFAGFGGYFSGFGDMPVVTNDKDFPVCDSGNLVVSNGDWDTYVWYKNDVIDPSVTGNTYPNADPGEYRVEVGLNGNSCTAISAPVTIYETPVINVETPFQLCSSESSTQTFGDLDLGGVNFDPEAVVYDAETGGNVIDNTTLILDLVSAGERKTYYADFPSISDNPCGSSRYPFDIKVNSDEDSFCADTDTDSVNNYLDLDNDNDGILDTIENCTLTSINIINGSTPWIGTTTGANVTVSTTTTGTNSSIVTTSSTESFNINNQQIVEYTDAVQINADADTNTTVITYTFSQAITTEEFGIFLEDFDRGNPSGSISVSGGTADTSDFEIKKVIRSGETTVSPIFALFAGPGLIAFPTPPTSTEIDSGILIGTNSNTFTELILTLNNIGNEGSGDDIRIHLIPLKSCVNDIDGDGIDNYLDLDSDGDSCPDAFESDVLSATGNPVLEAGDVINGDGTTNTTVSTKNAIVTGGYGANGFADTLETSEDGVFTGIYTYSNALDALVSNCFCLIDGATGVGATSDVGMSTLKRLKVLDPISNWPHNIANGHLVLESKDKGLVLTRIANPETAITNPIEGMMVYDMDDRCLKLYDGTTWGCIEQTCPD